MKENPKTTLRLQKFLVGLALALVLCACLASGFSLLTFYFGDLRLVPAAPPTGSVQVDELEKRVRVLEQEQATLLRTIAWTLDQKLYYLTGAALFISSLAAFFGWKSYKDLDAVISEKIRTTLDNELYQLDPVNLTIRLPKGHPDQDSLARRLRAAGLKNLQEYTELSDRCKFGLTLVPIQDEEDAQKYMGFLARANPGVDDAAFVLYVTNGYKISQDVINKHDRAATANMPATVVTAILAISRGLHRDRALSDKKEGA